MVTPFITDIGAEIDYFADGLAVGGTSHMVRGLSTLTASSSG